jgi:hypothetical protein
MPASVQLAFQREASANAAISVAEAAWPSVPRKSSRVTRPANLPSVAATPSRYTMPIAEIGPSLQMQSRCRNSCADPDTPTGHTVAPTRRMP